VILENKGIRSKRRGTSVGGKRMKITVSDEIRDLTEFLKAEIIEAFNKGDLERAEKLQRISDGISWVEKARWN